MSWDTTKPAGSRAISLGDDDIREFKTDVQTSLRGNAAEGTEAVFPGSDAANPVFRYRGLKGITGDRPASGQYGLYFDTTRNVLQRDNGLTWDDIAGGLGIESGVKMVFYQAAAPTGWTAVAVNDKFLRVVTAGGSGGSTGGTVAASTSLAHTHTVASHTHDLGNHTHSTPAHQHDLEYDQGFNTDNSGLGTPATTEEIWSYSTASGSVIYRGRPSGVSLSNTFFVAKRIHDRTQNSGSGTSGTPSTNTSGGTSPATDSQLGVFAYADVIIATKD